MPRQLQKVGLIGLVEHDVDGHHAARVQAKVAVLWCSETPHTEGLQQLTTVRIPFCADMGGAPVSKKRTGLGTV